MKTSNKSNFKVTFINKKDLFQFSNEFFTLLKRRQDWWNKCDITCHKGNTLYIQTANYTCVENWIYNQTLRYNITDLASTTRTF